MAPGLVLVAILMGFFGDCSPAEVDTRQCRKAQTFGYEYPNFYEIEIGASKSEGSDLLFEFLVKAKSDAHIALTSTPDLDDPGKSYEIVLGGGKNSFSQIRLWKKGTLTNVMKADVLSGLSYKGFWIRVSHSTGKIEVGEQGQSQPLLSWQNNTPFPIKYFAFSTWTAVKGEWLFGCSHLVPPEFNDEFEITGIKKLKADLLSYYDPFVLPCESNHQLKVEADVRIHNIYLDERTALLTTDGVMSLKWSDEKLRWNPSNYSDIDTLYLTPFDVWTPNILVLSGIVSHPMFNLNKVGVVSKSDGSMFWNPPVHFDSYCSINIVNWPQDVHNCSIFMGFLMEPRNLLLTFPQRSAVTLNRGGHEWEILKTKTRMSAFDPGVWVVDVVMSRRHQGDYLVLISPFIATAILVLCSFWVRPDHQGQLPLSCISMVVLVVMIMDICERIPVMQDSVPKIVTVYSCALLVNCVPILLYVALKNLPRTVMCPRAVHQFLAKMSSQGKEDQSLYSKLSERQAPEENPSSSSASRQPTSTIFLALAVQRFFFILYCCVFIYLLFLAS